MRLPHSGYRVGGAIEPQGYNMETVKTSQGSIRDRSTTTKIYSNLDANVGVIVYATGAS